MSTSPAAELRKLFIEFRDLEAPLNERLAAYAAASRKLRPAYGEAIDRIVQRLNENGGWENAPRVGEPMPPFMLPDENGHLVSLQELLEQGPTAIMFHRGHWCAYCRLNLHAVARSAGAIAAAGGRVAIVMPERQEFAEGFKTETSAPFPILADLDNGYAMSLDLAIWLGPDFIQLISNSGRDVAKFQGNDAWIVPIPATFVVGRDGNVVARFIDPDFRKRMELDDLLAAFKTAARG
jgi:peroxiredoxin